ncbi:DUF2905 domain-containing protein [bacterium]|nr:DUF2905 domain-containing protein [bacterium]
MNSINFNDIGKLTIFFGLFLVFFGALILFFGKIGFGKLPGDIYVKKGNFTFYAPIISSLLISIILSIIFSLIFKIFKK